MKDPWKMLDLRKLLQDAERAAESRIAELEVQVRLQLGQLPRRGDTMSAANYVWLMERSLLRGHLDWALVPQVHSCLVEPPYVHGKSRRVLHDMV